MFKRDIFGHPVFMKRMLISLVGIITFARYNWYNKIRISGTEHLENLPTKNVLFVSNHQTYFADVIALVHTMSAKRWGFCDSFRNPIYLLYPKANVYFVAAEETMKAGFLPKLFSYLGSISIQRTWREAGKDINRQVQLSDITFIGKALEDGWVITFPQGTTTAFAPGRRGTAHIIKKYQPIVIPVTINGFRRAFDKKGLFLKKRGVTLEVKFKAPLALNYEEDSDVILDQIMKAIEQSDEFKNPNFNSETLEK